MPTKDWSALIHLNYGCAAAVCFLRPDGRVLEFSTPQHGESQILFNPDISKKMRDAFQAGLELISQLPLTVADDLETRDADCRQTIERTLPVIDRFCSELQSRHDSLRDENGAHAAPIASCDCEMSRLHRVIVNSLEAVREQFVR